MKKRIICIFVIMLMVLSLSVTVFADETAASGQVSADTVPTSETELMYAKLQLAQQQQEAQITADQIAAVEEKQKEQKIVGGYLVTARQCKVDAFNTGEETLMPSAMAEYMDLNNLSYDKTGDDLYMSDDEWDTAISSLENRLAALGNEIQLSAMLIQSSIEPHNSQGTDTVSSGSNQTLSSIARGQSMYGDSDAGLAVTGLVVGLVLGCAATLAVQKVIRKKDKA